MNYIADSTPPPHPDYKENRQQNELTVGQNGIITIVREQHPKTCCKMSHTLHL